MLSYITFYLSREFARNDHLVEKPFDFVVGGLLSKATNLSGLVHCMKNHILFFQMFWKDVLPKKSHWNMIFLVSSGKMIFLFPENMIFFIRRKMKDDLSQKNMRKYDILFKCSEKMVFPKNRSWIWSFFHHQERWHFFFPKIWYFFYGRKMKDDLSEKIHENMTFPVCLVKMVFLFPTNMKVPFCQKSKDDLFPKNTP